MYDFIFFTNVLRILEERGMTKQELGKRSGVSVSFLSDLTTGKGNPSLKTMEAIATALDVALPLLLEATDMDSKTLEELAGHPILKSLPEGYDRITAVLPEHKAFIVKKWAEDAQRKIKEKK